MSRFRSIEELFDSPVHTGDPDVQLDPIHLDAPAPIVPAALFDALAPQLQELATTVPRRDMPTPALQHWTLLGARLRRLH